MKYKTTDLSIIQKIFIWALLFEPLKYFLLSTESVVGFALTVPKIIQGIFFFFFLIFFFIDGQIKLNKSIFNFIYFFIIFLFILIFSTIIAFLSGNYQIGESTNSIVQLSPIYNILVTLYYLFFFCIFAFNNN
mgnify:CR=1 FL=1